LPSPQDRLLFVLTYLKQAPTQAFQGAAFGMGQSKANQWIHVLLPALRTALASLGDLPSRGLADLRDRLADLRTDVLAAPFFTMAPSAPERALRTRMNKAAVIAARKSAIR